MKGFVQDIEGLALKNDDYGKAACRQVNTPASPWLNSMS